MLFDLRGWNSGCILTLILAAAASAHGEAVALKLHLYDSLGKCDLNEARLKLRSPEGVARETALTGHDVVVGTGHDVVVGIDESGVDRAQLGAAGCWSPEVELTIPAGITEAVVPVFGTARMLGNIRKLPNASISGVRGRLFLRSDDVSEKAYEMFAHKGEPVDCNIEQGRFSCEVPIGPVFDLRLESPGFSPALFWDVGPKDLRAVSQILSIELEEGGKVVGWVESGDEAELQGAEIALYPREERRPNQEVRWSRVLWARSGESGFFEFDGVAPGEYDLESIVPELSSVVVRGIAVRAGETTRLPVPISHPPVSSIEISISPPLDSKGKRWRVSLQDDQHGPSSRLTTRGQASVAGLWLAEQLRAQRYWLSVSSGEGEGVLGQHVDLSQGGHFDLNLQLKYVPVEGLVKLGTDPTEARLIFRNNAAQSVKANTEDDGRFDAIFPSSGVWNVTVQLMDSDRSSSAIRAEDIELLDTLEPQEIEIVLPDGTIRGTVVDSHGEGLPAAVYLRGNHGRVAHEATSPEGVFQLRGVPEGTYSIRAEAAGKQMSQQLSIRLTEGETVDVDLRVEEGTEIVGKVLSPEGNPMSGVSVKISFDGGRTASLVSSLDGTFRIMAQPRSTEAWVLVLSHSYPVAVRRFRLPASQPLTVHLLPVGSVLHVRGDSMPRIVLGGRTIPRFMLFYPPPFGERNGGVFLEPGPVIVCPEVGSMSDCQETLLRPAGETVVDLSQHSE